jgi:hypothetical protein
MMQVKIKWQSGLAINSTHSLVEGTGTLNTLENSTKTFKIYPNPFKNTLNIEGLNSNKSQKFLVINSEGKFIHAQFLRRKTLEIIDVSSFKPGIYFYQILENQKIIQSGNLIKN